jgi:hypothetical protein
MRMKRVVCNLEGRAGELRQVAEIEWIELTLLP